MTILITLRLHGGCIGDIFRTGILTLSRELRTGITGGLEGDGQKTLSSVLNFLILYKLVPDSELHRELFFA